MQFLKQYFNRYPAFRYRDYRLLWSGQLISITGSQMEMVALNWHIYLLTHSAVALGIIGLVRVIPIIIFSLIGGSIADAHNRRRTLLITQTTSAVLALLLALCTFQGNITPTIIYVITAISAAVKAIDTPSRQAFFPSLVKKEHLMNAISLNIIMFQIASIAGPALAGLFIAQFSIGNVYLFNSLSFVAVIFGLLLMHATGEIEGEKTIVSRQSIKEGIQFAFSKSIIWSTMLLDFLSTFFSSATALLPIFAADILRVGPQGLGLLYAAPAIGAVIAGFVIAHIGNFGKQGKMLLYSVFVYGIGTILFGFSKNFYVSLLALFIVGAGDSISTVIRHTIRQVVTPDSMRGRIVALNMIFFQGGPQLGEFEAGLVAALIGAPLSVITGGIATLFVVSLMAYALPSLRTYDRHE